MGKLHKPSAGPNDPHLIAGRDRKVMYGEWYSPNGQYACLAAVLHGPDVGFLLGDQVYDLKDLGSDREHGLGLSAEDGCYEGWGSEC